MFFSLYLVIVVVLTLLPSFIFSQSKHSLPINEYNALYDLYNSTNGKDWRWKKPFSIEDGYAWSFETPSQNPCSATEPWQGVSCTSTCGDSVCHIIQIDLAYHNLCGTLPASITEINNLQSIRFSNNYLTGSIPASLGNLSALNSLYLNQNKLTGTIPVSLGNLTALKELYLNQNQLTGTIPISLGNLSELEEFDLDTNQLTGTIPASLGNLRTLEKLYLYINQLTGTIQYQYHWAI
jgi:Leucine-rich repeat (LRR) protein